MSQRTTPSNNIKAILFDFMGTCLNWHTTVLSSLPSSIPSSVASTLALKWRHAYFDSNAARLKANLPPEDIDITHLWVLNSLLESEEFQSLKPLFTDEVKNNAIQAWHRQKAWPEVGEAIMKLRERGYELFVHANGTTRLQLNNVRSSGLHFDMLFSSELLGCYKPAPESYQRVLERLKLKSEECVLVAAHVMDTRGAKNVGMKTVYVRRWTDDIHEDQEVIKGENDAYLEDMKELSEVISKL